jgi:hypothetical protein
LTFATVEGRTGRVISDFKVQVSRGEHQRVNLTYTAPSIVDDEDQSASHAAFVATESLLGERCLNHWIGAIEIISEPRTKTRKSLFGRGAKNLLHFHKLDNLYETASALIGSIRDQLPPNPHYEWISEAEWTLWELNPKESDDYFAQQDLFVGKSGNPAQWTAAHSGSLFFSERFGRCGETFCYVKIDGSHGLDEDGFKDKSEIEDALDAALKPAKLGCCIGGGMGRRYAYVDLALTDVDKGIEIVRRRLRDGRVPRRSWIQFYDSDLEAEWVGVYDDSPQPPTPQNFC